jgi:hypothetical protein
VAALCGGRRTLCGPQPGGSRDPHRARDGTASREWRRPLGYAVIDTGSGTGTLATISLNRVEDVAHQTGAGVAVLLGRAIAHEVGHLLLHTNAHGADGLMRAVWTAQEMSRNAREGWLFATPERRLIRAALLRAGTSTR